jgi:hypothetical protein
MATKLYHVTPARNGPFDNHFEIDPSYSKGKTLRSWFVDENRVEWALAHCSSRHKVPVNELAIIMVNVRDSSKFKRTCWSGVYTSTEKQMGARVVPAEFWLNTSDKYPHLSEDDSEDDEE